MIYSILGQKDLLEKWKKFDPIGMYPNPVKDVIRINTQTVGDLSIFDSKGLLVKQLNEERQTSYYNIENIAYGVYYF